MAFTITLPDDCGVNDTPQLPEVRLQLPDVGITEPPDAVKLTTPVGVVVVPGDVSVTVAVQLEAWPTLTEMHCTTVLVERLFTVIEAPVAVWLAL